MTKTLGEIGAATETPTYLLAGNGPNSTSSTTQTLAKLAIAAILKTPLYLPRQK